MKRRRKLAIFTVVILMFSTSMLSYANRFTDIGNNPHHDAIIEIANLGILEGVGNDRFAPDVELNRAAAAKVAAYLIGYTEEDARAAASWDPLFNDVYPGVGAHEWALGWINLVANDGIIVGVPGGNYNPGAPLQMVQWATILMRILNHESTDMAWPNDHNIKAASLGLTNHLDYSALRVMNRAEMARMTASAIFDVPNLAGDLLIDILDFQIPEPTAPPDEPVIYDNAGLTLSATSNIVSAGGGQVIELVAKATYGPNYLPAANTRIEFFASVGPHDRRNQLSDKEVLTDENGYATTRFTTLKEDDNDLIMILANLHTDGDWIERTVSILASNNAAYLSGKLINPFTGDVVNDAEVGASKNGAYIPIDINEDGSYSSPIGSGEYYINFRFNIGNTNPFPGTYRGSHFTLDTSGNALIMVRRSFVAGSDYIIPSELGIVTGTTTRQSPQTDLYITQKGTNNTFVATVNAENRILITLPPGTYELGTRTGTILKDNIVITKGTVTNIGSF